MGSLTVAINGLENGGFMETEFTELQKPPEPPTYAVELISASKKYGKMAVLDKFNMHVEEGTIYTLLGASGCGKTTALSCVIGVNKLDSGKVRIFGEAPASPNSGVPGKRLGYMPQGIVLNREFTMGEVLHYFGKIYGLSYEAVEARRTFFCEFLNLKTVGEHHLIGNMSEGQKRRVSFAVALVHEPEILILDEPTVGVDPLLRERMWSHLVELTKDKMTTVIITTHYVEETRTANTIGLMRNGHLLVEESPGTLLAAFHTTSMEDIVFQLCLRDTHENDHAEVQRRESIISQLQNKDSVGMPNGGEPETRSRRQKASNLNSAKWRESLTTRSFDRINALFRKNLIVAYRSIWFWSFLLLMPALNIYLICVCLTPQPRDLGFGVVNHEVPIGEECYDFGDICITANLSCRYITELGNSTLTLMNFESEKAALAAVVNGNTYGYMVIPANFSDNLVERFLGSSQGETDQVQINETILGSQINLRLDMSHTYLGLRMEYLFHSAFRRFSRNLQISCGQNPDQRDIPLVFQKPIYGVAGSLTNNYVVPGAAITFLSFLASLTCGLAFITEKNDGMLTRARVAGVTHPEIMLSHLSIHFVVLLIQSIFAFLVMFLVFNIPQMGSNVLAYSIVILNGITGMSLGFIAASICDRETNAMMVAIGAIIPTLLISGTLSPFEALPQVIKYVGYAYPGTLPGFAVKAILFKGWGLEHFTVWMGFVTSIGWIIFFWSIIFIYHSYKS